jgi:hypothetical protein
MSIEIIPTGVVLGADRSGFVEKTHDEVDLIWIDALLQ